MNAAPAGSAGSAPRKPGYEVRLGDDVFAITIRAGRLTIDRGEMDRPDATITTDPMTLAALLWHDGDLEAERAGAVRIDGDRDAAERFFMLFPLPGRVS